MTTKELREKTVSELHKQLQELRGELLTIRFKIQAGQYKKVRDVRVIRQNIARTLTVLNEKQEA